MLGPILIQYHHELRINQRTQRDPVPPQEITASDLFARPQADYTRALLAAVPRMGQAALRPPVATEPIARLSDVVEVLGGTRNWAEPGDITVDELIRTLDQNTNHPGGINVAMADGSVIFLPIDVDREQLRRLLDHRDRKPVMIPNR